jgi:hypothetical protein
MEEVCAHPFFKDIDFDAITCATPPNQKHQLLNCFVRKLVIFLIKCGPLFYKSR